MQYTGPAWWKWTQAINPLLVCSGGEKSETKICERGIKRDKWKQGFFFFPLTLSHYDRDLDLTSAPPTYSIWQGVIQLIMWPLWCEPCSPEYWFSLSVCMCMCVSECVCARARWHWHILLWTRLEWASFQTASCQRMSSFNFFPLCHQCSLAFRCFVAKQKSSPFLHRLC